MVADRRYDYGDPISPLDFVRHGILSVRSSHRSLEKALASR
jgi:hypothetical protein